MNTWHIIVIILGLLFAASWGTIIPVCVSFWSKLKKLYADYKAAVADGTITDAEKIQLANDAMQAIEDAANIFQFVGNLIAAIVKVIQLAKLKKAQSK